MGFAFHLSETAGSVYWLVRLFLYLLKPPRSEIKNVFMFKIIDRRFICMTGNFDPNTTAVQPLGGLKVAMSVAFSYDSSSGK